MGLLIHTAFETREGVPIQSVYSRIISLACDFRGYYTNLTIVHETYLNRDKRIGGFAPLFAPTLQYRISVEVPYNSAWGDTAFLYTKVKERLTEMGITAEDVLEDPPQPPPAPEPAPAEEPPAETPPS
jgi:hypothetical protein